ncbi:MAG: MHYT domain-containing protein [Acidovorax sp.]
MLEQFFASDIPPDPRLWQQHDPWLVALSVLLAVGASVMALHMAALARRASSSGLRRWTLGAGALALGGGIWAMHFVGMLAFSVCAHGDFAYGVTAASMLPGVAAAWVALWLLARPQVGARTLAGGGVLMGAGIGAMHYSGMAASSVMPALRYDPLWFALSLVVAVLLATLALWVRFGVRRWLRGEPATLLAGAVMGMAITGMHYTGMAGLRFAGPVDTALHTGQQVALALSIAMVVLVFSTLVIAITASLRFWQMYQQSQRNESRLRAVFDTAVDGIIMIDGRGIVQSFNGGAQRILGWTAAEVIGRNVNLLMPEPYHGEHDGYLHAYHATGHARIIGKGREVEALTKDGRVLPIRLAVGQVQRTGARLYVGFITDISELRAAEQTLRETRGRAEVATARSAFLANMSHEIRTPMNAILGFTEALLDSPLDATQRRHLGTVHNAARSMLRLLNDILDTAKLEKGAVTLEIADFSLRELCRQTLASLRITAARKALALELDYPLDQPDYLRGDALRLQQVLVNLLGNALKFTEKGRVLLRVRHVQGELRLDVEDTGIGIEAGALERIFDPFAQADTSTSRRFGGTGLGTTISRQLVELMQGGISVRSTMGVGTVFSVRLPLPLGDAQAARQHLPPGIRALPMLRVLAVDDVPNNLELLNITLKRGRHDLTLAHGGEEAVQLCAAERFDVVLMDLQMPDVDGLEATRRIRAHEQARQQRPVPIIALSASVLAQDRRNARAAGMDGFAVKPLELPRLYAEIARVLGLRAEGADSAEGPLSEPVPLLPQSHPADEPAPAAIDWERGLRLWAQAPLMRDAIERFLNEYQGLPERLQALHTSGDWPGLRAAVHRLRGVAGNLALVPLHALLSRLETSARAADGHAAGSDLAALPAAWNAVAQALYAQTEAPAEAPPPTAAGGALDTLDAPRAAQALAALDQAAAALAQGELPDAALATLATLLPALALEPARAAVDRFDFDRAQTCLLALREPLAARGAP